MFSIYNPFSSLHMQIHILCKFERLLEYFLSYSCWSFSASFVSWLLLSQVDMHGKVPQLSVFLHSLLLFLRLGNEKWTSLNFTDSFSAGSHLIMRYLSRCFLSIFELNFRVKIIFSILQILYFVLWYPHSVVNKNAWKEAVLQRLTD